MSTIEIPIEIVSPVRRSGAVIYEYAADPLVARYKKGSFQLECNNTVYARRILLEDERDNDPSPMINAEDKKTPTDGVKLDHMIRMTVDGQHFLYGPAQTFRIPVKDSDQHAIYVQGELTVQYGGSTYRTPNAFPLIHVGKLTVGELQRDSKRISLVTPLGGHLLGEFVDREPEERIGKRSHDDSELVQAKKERRESAAD